MKCLRVHLNKRPTSGVPKCDQAFRLEDDEIYKLISLSGSSISKIEKEYLGKMTECQELSALKVKIHSKMAKLAKRTSDILNLK